MLRLCCVSARPFSTCTVVRAGHSKWQNIKHTKARNDAKRSKNNTKLAHMITVAAREGGGPDLAKNVRLATMVESALKQNISKRVIDGAIARASKTPGANGEATSSIVYEGIGPGGVAVIVEALTDNKNRTAQNVRAAFLKYKGNLSPSAFMFERKGWIALASPDLDYDSVLETALDLGVDDVVESESGFVLYTQPSDLAAVAKQAREHFELESLGLSYEPISDQAVQSLDAETGERVAKMVAMLEDLEDVSSVYTNFRPVD